MISYILQLSEKFADSKRNVAVEMMSANDGLNLLTVLFSKAVWFLKLYISQYKELLIFIAVFVVLYIFFMHWFNVRFLNCLR